VASAARYANVLDYAGPNLAPNQLIIYTPNGPYGQNGPGSGSGTAVTGSKLRSMAASARGLAAALGSHDMVQLDSTSATLQHAASGRNWSGPVFVATPQLLRAFGIKPSQVDPTADILTMRPGLAGMSGMQIVYGRYYTSGTGPLTHNGHETFPCPRSDCLAGPRIQEVSGLPPGTSAPNTVITEHAVRRLGLRAITSGWLIQTPHALTAAQISSARLAAVAAGMSVETRSSVPTSAAITNWATAFGIVLALAILAMAVGLLRSETASDLRTLTATGAGPMTRRNLTAVTAGALALLGALLGTAAGYVASIAWFRGSALNGGVGALANAPVGDLLFIVVGMPLIAVAVGWLLAGREPPAIAHQPIE
jgi:putative ABC transport system permease protein